MKRLYDKALMDQIAKVYGNEVRFLSEFSRALLDIIREGLIRDGQVRLHQFGTFKLRWMNTRNGVNPSTGEKIIIQGRPRVIFTPAKSLKEIIEPAPAALIPMDQTENAINSPLNIIATDEISETKVASEDQPEELINLVLADEIESDQDVSAAVTESDNVTEHEHFTESEAEEVIADIEDEIEVLEQVADILKTEEAESVSITDEVNELDALESEFESKQPENLNEDSFETENLEVEVENLDLESEFVDELLPVEELVVEDNEVISAEDNQHSAWADKSVIDDIKQISELQYFKKTAEP
ncbi:MAG: HU family DNA-binding protein, partial [Gammaproteobacteria bacterium]|nr:HU family DNA-binding protein [Gammaproteobacteria bacterium]